PGRKQKKWRQERYPSHVKSLVHLRHFPTTFGPTSPPQWPSTRTFYGFLRIFTTSKITKITKRTHFQKIQTPANTGFSHRPPPPSAQKRTHFLSRGSFSEGGFLSRRSFSEGGSPFKSN